MTKIIFLWPPIGSSGIVPRVRVNSRTGRKGVTAGGNDSEKKKVLC